MNNLEKQIATIFLMNKGTIMPINLEGCPGYLARGINNFNAAIPFNLDIDIEEEFVGLKIFKTFVNYEGNSIKSLCISASETIDVNKFSIVVNDFLSADNRRTLLTDPFDWIDKWKEIFGDSLKKKKVYDVLGEMIALKCCFEKDKTFVWTGPDSGTHDIVGEEKIVEVKSTNKKTGSTVNINSSYQLSAEKPTYLFLIRLEKKPYSLSINSLASNLVDLGYPEQQLERSLVLCGYKKGNRLRDETYDLLEALSYEISKNQFPIMSIEDINRFAPRKNIVGYSIEIDLVGLEHTKVLFKK